jgi:hypothetical protein
VRDLDARQVIRFPAAEAAASNQTLSAAADRAGKLLYFNATTGALEEIGADDLNEAFQLVATGPAGPAGADGAAGADGQGVPTGGTTGQVLTKSSNADYDSAWDDATGGGSTNYINVTSAPYNAVADALFRHDAAISASSSTLTSATAGFAAGDVGKYIRVVGAGTTATATLSITGGAITGYSITQAGSAGAYPASTTFPVWVTDAAGINASLTAATNSTGQISSITIVAAGTGYLAPTVAFPEADLIATISTRISGTQVTLSRSATTTVSAKDVYWGTDSTTAIQSAITAATAANLKVYIPRGSYLCNVLGTSEIELFGDGGGNELSGMPSYISIGVNLAPTCLFPAHNALPVIRYDNKAFGASIKRMCVIGSFQRRGIGIQIGDLEGNSYYSQNTDFDQVSVFGFDKCYVFKNAHIESRCLNIGEANTGIWCGPITTGEGGTNMTISGLAGYDCTTFFDGNLYAGISPLRLTLTNADLNRGTTAFRNVNVSATRLNVETITGNCIENSAQNGYAYLDEFIALNLTGAVVANKGGIDFKTKITASTSGFYYTATAEYPEYLSRNMIINRYSSTAFTTLMEKEWAVLVYAKQNLLDKYKSFADAFVGTTTGAAGTAISEQGWKASNISGTFANRAYTGGTEFYSNNTAVGTAGRFALPQAFIVPNSEYWEFRSVFRPYRNTVALNAMKVRFGLYELEGTADMNPTYGVGILCDITSSNYVQLEIRNSGSSTLVPTTCLISDFYATAKEIKLLRVPAAQGGVFLTISAREGAAYCPQVSSTASLTGSSSTMAWFCEVQDTIAYPSIFIENFSMRLLPSF